MALEKEIKTYQACLSSLMEENGRYVLIQAEEVVGVYDSYDDAQAIGYERFGLDPFLVKRIQAESPHSLFRV